MVFDMRQHRRFLNFPTLGNLVVVGGFLNAEKSRAANFKTFCVDLFHILIITCASYCYTIHARHLLERLVFFLDLYQF